MKVMREARVTVWIELPEDVSEYDDAAIERLCDEVLDDVTRARSHKDADVAYVTEGTEWVGGYELTN